MAGPWWLFLVTGITWLIISVAVLRFTTTSIATVGVLLGVLFLLAAVNEFMISAVRHSWRWAHILLGILFVVGAIWAFARPVNAFWSIASVLGLLLIFKGTLDIIGAVMTKDVNSSWWLGLVVGILELVLGFWASQQLFPARSALLLLWGRVLRPVPRHLRDRHRLRGPEPPARLARRAHQASRTLIGRLTTELHRRVMGNPAR
jgi:uncharacterized membrane protein HdeD (DUF308 family)